MLYIIAIAQYIFMILRILWRTTGLHFSAKLYKSTFSINSSYSWVFINVPMFIKTWYWSVVGSELTAYSADQNNIRFFLCIFAFNF